MDDFWKTAAAVLLTAILSLAVGKQEKDISVLLIMAVSCMAAFIAIGYLEPVFDFLREVETAGQLENGMLDILLKAVGIALAAELAGLVCSDAGSGSLGKSIQLLGSAAILYLSVPAFRTLLTLIREILGDV